MAKKYDTDVNDKEFLTTEKQVVYAIIDDYMDNPLEGLKVYSDGSEALKDLGRGNSLRAYQVEDKAQITKYNEKYGKKGENK
jgi:hypothetical protein